MKKYDYWLWCVEGIGGIAMKRFADAKLSARDVYYLRDKTIENLAFLSEKQKAAIITAKKRNIEKDYEELLRSNVNFITKKDAIYPRRLLQVANAPYGLFYRGHLPKEDVITVAIVGARNCTNYGRKMTEEIAEELSNDGIYVVSGMARGIDGAAHRGALRGESDTFAVLGCGADICYPTENRDLYDAMLERGGILSEYPPHMNALARHFPQRNRIISGLADCVLVAEAKEKSGSLITVDYALEQGKEVFALPGPVDSYLSAGCHQLIHQGAEIFTSVDALLKDLFLLRIFHENMPMVPQELLGEEQLLPQNSGKNNSILHLEKEEAIVYSEITLRPKSVETIAQNTAFSAEKVRGILVLLQMRGYITEVGKNQYILN